MAVYSNALLPMVVRSVQWERSSSPVRAVSRNAPAPMDWSESGSLKEVMAVSENALLPMVVRLVQPERSSRVSAVQLLNA